MMNIHTNKLSNKDVNVGKCIEISSEQVRKFHQTLPEGFHDPLRKEVKTIFILHKHIQVNDEKIIDTSLIYFKVMQLQYNQQI